MGISYVAIAICRIKKLPGKTYSAGTHAVHNVCKVTALFTFLWNAFVTKIPFILFPHKLILYPNKLISYLYIWNAIL